MSTVQKVEACHFCLVVVVVVGCSYWIDQLTLGAWWCMLGMKPHNSETGLI